MTCKMEGALTAKYWRPLATCIFWGSKVPPSFKTDAGFRVVAGKTPLEAVTEATPPKCAADEPKDDVARAKAMWCACLLKDDDTLYVKDRFPITSIPSVRVLHETEKFKPRSILYVEVTSAAGLDSAVLKDQQGAIVLTLKGGFDPEQGPIWYGSMLYLDGSGAPPPADKLPFTLEMQDKIGRTFTKPIVIQN